MKTTTLARGIYRRASGRLLVAWRQGGRFCRHLMPRGATLTDAKKYRQQRLGEAASGALSGLPGRFTYADLLKLLGPRSRATQALREAWPATMPAKDLTADRIRAYEAERLAAGKARSTVNFDLAALRHAFNLALQVERVAKVPVIKTPTPDNVRTGFFEREVLDRVLDKLPARYRPVVLFLYYTGWRVGSKRGETLHLRWRENVDWRAQVVRLEPGTTKNKQGREFPFGELPALKRLLEAQLAAAEASASPWVFHREDGRPLGYKRLRLAFQRACREAKVSGRILHDLRRTAVRNLVRAGVAQVVAMSLTGHRTTAVFHRYAIVDTQLQREGVAKLVALHA